MKPDKLTERQKFILSRLIEVHVKLAQPVGSQALAEAMQLHVSSATIRNEMSELEQLGYITHLHTSAGRLPTDKGYRFYVNEISENDMADARIGKQVMASFSKKIRDMEELIDVTSKILALLTEQASVVVLPEPEFLYLKDVKLIALESHRLLVVWTTTDGVVSHRLVDIEKKITPELCKRIMALLNEELAGRKLGEIEYILLDKLKDCRDTLRSMYELAREIMNVSLTGAEIPSLKTSGSGYMFDKPEFRDVSILQRIFRILQGEGKNIGSLIRSGNWTEGVQVSIGTENPSDLKECSIVSAPYRLGHDAIGSLAVIGPRRMPYRSTMSTVYYVSRMLSEALERLNMIQDKFEEGDYDA